MNRIILLAGFLLITACHGTEPSPPERVRITFSATGGTRSDTDGDIRRWALLLFCDGKLADYGFSDSAEPITRTVQAAAYTAFAVANYPENGFRPESFLRISDLTERTVDLADHTADAPVMCGRRDLVLPAGADGVQPIAVERLVCRADIRKVSVDFTDPTLAARQFVLKSVFLTNCLRTNRYGSDYSREQVPDAEAFWYNRMGPAPESPGSLTVNKIDAVISTDRPYSSPHSFLYHPNPTAAEQDTRAETWSARCTRLVIEAQIGDRTCFYPVTLPVLRRNQTCVIDEVVIRRAGSPDPEQEIPEAVEIVFSTSVQPWEQQYHDQDAS